MTPPAELVALCEREYPRLVGVLTGTIERAEVIALVETFVASLAP